MRDDHALDRQVAERVQRREQGLAVDSSKKTWSLPPVPLSTSPLTRVPCSRMRKPNSLRFAVELDRFHAVRQVAGRPGVGNLPPDGAGGTQTGRAVAFDEVGRTAVVRPFREEHPHRLPVRVEFAVGRQERVDQGDLVVRLVPHDRDLLGPVLRRLPVRVRREPPGELAHAGKITLQLLSGDEYVVDIPVVRAFIDAVRASIDAAASPEAACDAIRPRFAELLADPAWLPQEYRESAPESGMGGGIGQWLLFRAGDRSLSLFSLVVPPGAQTPVHDHLAWGLVGLYRGSQDEEIYAERDDRLELVESRTLGPGDFYALVPPRDDIHRVRTTSAEASVSIHLLTNDTGCIWRHSYDLESGERAPFRSGYVNVACDDAQRPSHRLPAPSDWARFERSLGPQSSFWIKTEAFVFASVPPPVVGRPTAAPDVWVSECQDRVGDCGDHDRLSSVLLGAGA